MTIDQYLSKLSETNIYRQPIRSIAIERACLIILVKKDLVERVHFRKFKLTEKGFLALDMRYENWLNSHCHLQLI